MYDFENYRYHLGPNVQVGNVYPVMYAQAFFDGMKKEGQENIVNLLRCAWPAARSMAHSYGPETFIPHLRVSRISLRQD